MADLNSLDEKLGEVIGLARAAQDTVAQVASMEDAEQFESDLDRMKAEAAETEERTVSLISGEAYEGKKTAILEKAQSTKSEAAEMRDAYLADEEEALDGFEFLTMAEAGELGHWEIVATIAETAGETEVKELADWAVGVQTKHFEGVRRAALELAKEEAKELASA
jgi:hypothetical protein